MKAKLTHVNYIRDGETNIGFADEIASYTYSFRGGVLERVTTTGRSFMERTYFWEVGEGWHQGRGPKNELQTAQVAKLENEAINIKFDLDELEKVYE